MQFKQYLLIPALFLFSSLSLHACMCLPKLEGRSLRNQGEYEYIALLEVKALQPHTSGEENKYQFTFELKEQIHGSKVDRLAVASYNPDFQDGETKISSSCDYILQEGVKYLIFAQEEDGEFITNFCGIVVMRSEGVGSYGFDSAHDILQVTRSAYNKPETAPIQNGVHETYFPNGQRAYRAKYKDGQLVGKKKRWLKNGKLHIVERYRNGRFHGLQQRFAVGNNYCIPYVEGKRVGKAKYFGAKKKEKYRQEWYDKNGIQVRSVQFDQDGNIRSEILYDPVTEKRTRKYFEKGKLIESSTDE